MNLAWIIAGLAGGAAAGILDVAVAVDDREDEACPPPGIQLLKAGAQIDAFHDT